MDVECGMWNVEWPFGTRIFSHRCHRSMRTDGSFHGSFTFAPLPAAWFLMRHRRNGSRFFRMRSETASVQIGEICGRQISAQCAKEQAGCIYSPTDLSDKHRCHADCLSITQIAPSARQIDTDFSHAENLSMRARFSGHALKGQKFIAQGKQSGALGVNRHTPSRHALQG